MPLDIALAYDPVNRRCDVAMTTLPSGAVDFALDRTFQTPVLMAVGCDRRAHADDELPSTTANAPVDAPLMNAKRGWPGDSLDTRGELTGSRHWTLARSKLDADVVRRALSIDREALSSLTGRQGVAIAITVERYGRNTLAHRFQVGGQTILVPQVVGG